MKQITIVFSKATTFFPIFSWLIMASERIPYSHVAMKIHDDETGNDIYYQASHTMVNVMSESVFLSEELIVYSFDFQVDDTIVVAIRKFAQDNMGKPYGVLSIVGLAYVQLLKWVGISVHNPFKEVGQEYVCSQFVGAALEKAANLGIDVDLDDLTPVMTYPIVKNLPKVWIKAV